MNVALRRAGMQPIASLTEANEKARVAATLYDNCRDYVFGIHPWNCATRRVSLAQSGTSPAFGYTRFYPVPTDYLRLIRAQWPQDSWTVETIRFNGADQKGFATDATPFNITYIARITDVNLMSPSLQDAIAWRLASEMAPRLTGSDSKMGNLAAMYQAALREAQFQDSMESPEMNRLEPTAFLNARHGLWGSDPSRVGW